MKPKFLLLFFVVTIALASFVSVKAMTEQERQALILSIQQQIAMLYAQIAQLQGTQTQTTSSTGTWCHYFSTNLRKGDTGSEVLALQTALEKSGFIILDSEQNSERFGDYTFNAVVNFQERYASEILSPLGLTRGTGNVSVSTRQKLNALYNCANNPITACAQLITPAKNYATGECRNFPTPCDVPNSWQRVNSCLTSTTTTTTPPTTLPTTCVQNWVCGAWSVCSNGVQTKSCYDTSNCGYLTGKPAMTQTCGSSTCTPNWQCSSWSACSVYGSQTKSCYDANNCGITTSKPAESQSCTVACSPNWQCTAWSGCVSGSQTKSCTDINNCGITNGKPAESQNCSPSCRYLIEPNHYDSEWYLDSKGYKITSGSCDNSISRKHYCEGGVEKESVLTCPLGCTATGLGGFCFKGVKFTYPADASQAVWLATNENTITWDYAGIDGSTRANLVFTDWTSGIAETHEVAVSDKKYTIGVFSPAYPGQDPPAGRTFEFSIASANPAVSNFETKPEYEISIIQTGWTYLSGLPSQVKNGQFDSERGADFYNPGKLYLFTTGGIGSTTMKTYYPDVCTNGMLYEKNCYLPANTPYGDPSRNTKIGCVPVQGDAYLFTGLNKNPYPCPFGCATDGAACKNPNCPRVLCVQDLCPGKHLPNANGCISCSSPCQLTFPGEQLGTLPPGF